MEAPGKAHRQCVSLATGHVTALRMATDCIIGLMEITGSAGLLIRQLRSWTPLELAGLALGGAVYVLVTEHSQKDCQCSF